MMEAVVMGKRMQPVLLSSHHGYSSFNPPNNPLVTGYHRILPTKETEAQSEESPQCSGRTRMKHCLLYPLLDASLLP